MLDSFIQSFGVLNHLAVRSETEVTLTLTLTLTLALAVALAETKVRPRYLPLPACCLAATWYQLPTHHLPPTYLLQVMEEYLAATWSQRRDANGTAMVV